MRGSNQKAKPGETLGPKWEKSEMLDIYFFVHENASLPEEVLEDPGWEVRDVGLSDVGEAARNLTFALPDSVKNNGTVYLHVFLAHHGWPICCPDDPEFDGDRFFWTSHQLNVYMPRAKETTSFNLLAGSTDNTTASDPVVKDATEEVDNENPPEIISYWKPSLTVAIVQEFGWYPKSKVLPHQKALMVLDDTELMYYPLVFFNEFWLLRDKLVPINETVHSLDLELKLTSMKPWMFQLFSQMDQSFAMQQQMGLAQDTDADDFKRILLEGNPILLGITFVVTILHTFFDFLAFKNDIGFWQKNKSMEGLSARSIVINCVCQVVIFLYLLDNETSFVIILSSGVGMLIEFWKVTKAMKVERCWWEIGGARLPWLSFKDRETYTASQTKKYDEQATRYLSYVLYPLVIGYAIYSLIYDEHKSWYSWLLSSFVGAVYMFGFILMCPQLYLNYKLKSVAHLPWRQLTYKFLNTIIDDLFAFVIKMPILHRLSVFRDDVVFLVFIYQWWLYGVDKTRTNEFGFSSEPPPEGQATENNQISGGVDAGQDSQVTEELQEPAGLRKRRQGQGEEAEVVAGQEESEQVESSSKKDK